jgi:hypothetical protein
MAIDLKLIEIESFIFFWGAICKTVLKSAERVLLRFFL